jgi:hypothetical protein
MSLSSLRTPRNRRRLFLVLPAIVIVGALLAVVIHRLVNPPTAAAQSSVITKPISSAYRVERSSASGTIPAGATAWVYELPCGGNVCHIQYVSVEVRVPAGQTAFAELGMPMPTTGVNIGEFSTIKLENLGAYPASGSPYFLPDGTYLGGNAMVDLHFPAKMGGETTPMPSRHLIVRRSAATGVAYVTVFVAGYVE